MSIISCLSFAGVLCNGRVRCPWHGACFNTKTGDIEDFPGLDSSPVFEASHNNLEIVHFAFEFELYEGFCCAFP